MVDTSEGTITAVRSWVTELRNDLIYHEAKNGEPVEFRTPLGWEDIRDRLTDLESVL